jgi:uncharacterized coiled-coil protein SlyX
MASLCLVVNDSKPRLPVAILVFVWSAAWIWSLLLVFEKQYCYNTKMSPPTKRKFPFDYDDNFGQLEPVVDGKLTNPGAAAVNCLESLVEIVKTKIAKIEKVMYTLDNMEGHLVCDKDVALAKLSNQCKVVAAKEKKVADSEKEKAALMEQLASKETTIKELNKTLAKKDAEIEQLKKEKLAISIKTIDGMGKLLDNFCGKLTDKSNGNA